MLRRMLALLLTALLALPLAAAGEDALPVLIDRINTPDVHADFAFAEDAPLLEVIFPQILNCDAIFLRCGGETMLVDCATQGQAKRIINMCKQLGITRIDRVVNTHPHEDHIGGFRDVIKEVEVGELWICFDENYTTHMTKAVGYAQKAGIPVVHYADGDTLTLGGATIDVWKLEGKTSELNDCSAQFFVTFGDRTLLMAADLEKTGQARYVEWKGGALKADVLKYPHHGLEKLIDEYAAAVSPLYFVVTNNQRSTEGLKYIRRGDIPCAWTVPGFVTLTTDGTTWLVERVESEVKY
ncbi:MAG: MBL fold metallo-hydrolase [Clostridiales bacterium]|nr:MBL fold metallo-hydrolase [Clostridiales bacterium]